ncbi:unnamed protein product [Macrosiphum euphorbiae]|uniref:Uncharacterized protein n=1 Tax=Macrosiphum euphorbiae TaxID=13131 RepID=A0AAV0YCU4_9HEMI|nr:unnamed protein product [Macrosiphum euphorbiae]
MLKFDTAGRPTGDFFANIFQRYENRPREHADYNFPAMCLMEFAMRFQPHYRKPRGEEEGEGNVDQDANDEVPVNFSLKSTDLGQGHTYQKRNVKSAEN